MKRFFLVTLITLVVMAPLTLTAQTTMFKFNQGWRVRRFHGIESTFLKHQFKCLAKPDDWLDSHGQHLSGGFQF
jgi:hypothetical protein